MKGKILFSGLLAFYFTTSSLCAAGVKDSFKAAEEAKGKKEYEKAAGIYQEIIDQHPSQVKSAIKAHSGLLDTYLAQGNNKGITDILSVLKAKFSKDGLDLKDMEKLAVLFLRHGEEGEGIRLLMQIIQNQSNDYKKDDNKVAMRAYSRLLKHYEQRGDEKSAEEVLNSLSSHPIVDFTPKDSYDLALTYMKYGRKETGLQLLSDLVTRYPGDETTGKAIFVLAREAEFNKDYRKAIDYYTLFINDHQKKPFFLYKAYSRLLDCYIAGNMIEPDKIQEFQKTIKDAADKVSGTSDYSAQMNFARELRYKGIEDLAQPTFEIGLANARAFISQNAGSYQALKAYLEIARYSHAFARFDEAQDAAKASLAMEIPQRGRREKFSQREIDFIRSQLTLWLGKSYEDMGSYEEAAATFEQFLRDFPGHNDADFASYELGALYEKLNQIDKAVERYKAVHGEAWKKPAEERLNYLGQ